MSEVRGRRNVILWVLQALLGFQFLVGGLLKVGGSQVMVDMFADIGAGQWLRYVVGVLEIAGAVGVLIPRLAGLAAVGLAGLMVGAVITRAAVLGGPPVAEVVILAVSLYVAKARWQQTRALLGGSAGTADTADSAAYGTATS